MRSANCRPEQRHHQWPLQRYVQRISHECEVYCASCYHRIIAGSRCHRTSISSARLFLLAMCAPNAPGDRELQVGFCGAAWFFLVCYRSRRFAATRDERRWCCRPSGCSRTRRAQNFLSPACRAAPATGSALGGANRDTSPTGLPRPTMAASPRCRCMFPLRARQVPRSVLLGAQLVSAACTTTTAGVLARARICRIAALGTGDAVVILHGLQRLPMPRSTHESCPGRPCCCCC